MVEMSEMNKARYAVVQSLRAIAIQWGKRSELYFTGREVAESLYNAANVLEERIKKETTIIKPGE